MAGVPLIWVDAFCDRPFAGNPAAVCLLERPASAPAMQSLAFELGVSETAFAWPEADGYSLRWFTPAAEVDLCGHATVATAHALRAAGRVGDGPVRFHTRSGVLTAGFETGSVVLDLPADPPAPVDTPAEVPAAWHVRAAAAGRFDLMVELPDAGTVRAVEPHEAATVAAGYRGVIVTAHGEANEGGGGLDRAGAPDYVLRFFAPAVGIPEDPVTGSAQCTLGPYWAVRLGRSELRAVQLSARRGLLQVAVAGDRVRVGGHAVTVLQGAVTGAASDLLLGSG
jgi:predicted PhzF superfamily epimerase YddE/YHI9